MACDILPVRSGAVPELLPPTKVKHLTEEKQEKFLTLHIAENCRLYIYNKGISIFNKKIC